MRNAVALLALLFLASCGGDSGGGGGGSGSSNLAPVITSANSASVQENVTGIVYQASAVSPAGRPITFGLDGEDGARFTITSTGAVSFLTPPDFEAPTDQGLNNTYVFNIIARDGTLETRLSVTITVTNTLDQPGMRRISNFTNLLDVATIPGSTNILALQQDGRIYQVGPADTSLGTLYMTVPGITGNARLVSLLADRNYGTNGQIYVYLLNSAGQLELRRYGRLSSGLGDPGSEDVLLRTATVPLPASTDNRRAMGGGMRFGSDGFLYLGIGVGRTAATDPSVASPAQDLSDLRGKVLRLDMSRDDFPGDANRDYGIPAGNPFAGGGGAGEIWAYGFEDPFSLQIDGGNVFVGDWHVSFSTVGKPAEMNLIRPQDAGANYGFPAESGPGITPPVIQIPTSGLFPNASIFVGPVYRGPVSQLTGQVLFNTDQSYPVAGLQQGTTLTSGFNNNTFIRNIMVPSDAGIVRITMDENNNLYFVSGSSWIYMLIIV